MSEVVQLPAEPGLYRDIPHESYMASDAFHSSLAHILLSRSPRHARYAYLGELEEEVPSEALTSGSLLHQLLLGTGQAIAVIDADSYRGKIARAQRTAALEAGQCPVLAAAYERAEKAASHIAENLADRGVELAAYEREVSMVWLEGATPCKGRMDLLDLSAGVVLDPKFVRNAGAFPRTIVPYGRDVQWAAYTSGLATIFPQLAGRIRMEFLAIEAYPPYAASRVRLAGSLRSLGELKWRRACETWQRCWETSEWPGYADVEAEARPWELVEEMVGSAEDPAWLNGGAE